MRLGKKLLLLGVPAILNAQGRSANWPVYGGNTDNTHYSTLDQITPENVRRLQVAWTYETHDEFQGSEMQANPIVLDGVLYATSPKMRVFALDAATGRELWSFDPSLGRPLAGRFRHRGVVVTGDRVLFNYRNRLWAIDRTTGRPIRSFGDNGAIDLREGLGRPVEKVTVNASSPGAVFEDLLIMGSTVPEGLPSHRDTSARLTSGPARCAGSFTRSRSPVNSDTRRGRLTRTGFRAGPTRGRA
jgi:quinoprotein glucose dehydrogenase